MMSFIYPKNYYFLPAGEAVLTKQLLNVISITCIVLLSGKVLADEAWSAYGPLTGNDENIYAMAASKYLEDNPDGWGPCQKPASVAKQSVSNGTNYRFQCVLSPQEAHETPTNARIGQARVVIWDIHVPTGRLFDGTVTHVQPME